MPVSEARKRANRKWDAANMQVIGCKVRRDYADAVRAAAAAAGTTPAAIMRRALDDFMNDHGAGPGPDETE